MWPYFTFVVLIALAILVTLYNNTKKNYQVAQHHLKRFQHVVDVEHEMRSLRRATERDVSKQKENANLYRKNIEKEIEQSQGLLNLREHEFESKLENYSHKINESIRDYRNQQSKLARLGKQLIEREEAVELEMSGFYEPQYPLLEVPQFAEKLQQIREEQKAIIKKKEAIVHLGGKNLGRGISLGQEKIEPIIRLALTALNTQIDHVILKVSVKNITTSEAHIQKIRANIDKLLNSSKCATKDRYINLKIQELYLAFEFEEQKEREKEELRARKEQMKEEKKLEKIADAELKKLEKEADHREKELNLARLEAEWMAEEQRKALEQQFAEIDTRATTEVERERLREELEQNFAIERALFEDQLQEKEAELAEAQRKKITISQAQTTKKGHVYIISNIGSFGPNVYKIGMSRRLDPTERIKELSGASVPFRFDTHAMIFSNDAPALEKALHQHFSALRVNSVNKRKEFFRASIEDIEVAVKHFCGDDIEFVKVAEAREFRQSKGAV